MVGDVLELARTLRRDGFVATHIAVDGVSITLEPVIAPQFPVSNRREKADPQGVVAEFGGDAVAKILGDDAEGDDEYVTAVRS